MRLGTKGIDVHPVLANRYESYSSYHGHLVIVHTKPTAL